MSTWPFWKLASTHGPSRICWTNPKRRCGSSQNTLKPLHFVQIFRRPRPGRPADEHGDVSGGQVRVAEGLCWYVGDAEGLVPLSSGVPAGSPAVVPADHEDRPESLPVLTIVETPHSRSLKFPTL